MSIIVGMLSWFKRPKAIVCQHVFDLDDLSSTNQEPIVEPDFHDYRGWQEYYANRTRHPSHTHRVQWPCRKCGKVFFAHCGLDISPKHGSTVQSVKLGRKVGV